MLYIYKDWYPPFPDPVMNELRRDSFASLLRLSSGSVLDIDAETSNTPKLHALHISDNMAITCADSARTSTKRDWTEVDSGESGDVVSFIVGCLEAIVTRFCYRNAVLSRTPNSKLS